MPQQVHRSGGRNSSAAGRDSERLQQLIVRMRAALQLGLRSTSLRKEGGQKWCNTDAEVQGQAVRAIAAFVAALPRHPFPILTVQTAVEEAVAALESLLGAEQEAVYRQAAAASAGLATATRGSMLLQLVRPLAGLLEPSKAAVAAASASTALQSILAAVKPRRGNHGLTRVDDPVWKILEEADVLGNIASRLQSGGSFDKHTGVAECAEVLALILERWPVARFRVGRLQSVRIALLTLGRSSSEFMAIAGLRACCALGVAMLLLQSGEALWVTVAHCLHSSNPSLVRVEALRFLSVLGRLPAFGASFSGPQMRTIVGGCLRGLEEWRKVRWSVEVEGVLLEAARATSAVLRWPGDHHIIFYQGEIIQVLLALLSEPLTRKDAFSTSKSKRVMEESPTKGRVDCQPFATGKLNPMLWPLVWEIIGWLATHCRSPLEKGSLSAKNSKAKVLGGLPAFACTSLLRALHKSDRGQSGANRMHTEEAGWEIEGVTMEEQQMSGQEVVQICKAVLLLLSSPSQALSASTRLCLSNALERHGHEWVPCLVDTLALGHIGPTVVKPDNLQTVTNLLALACFSWLPMCLELLLQCNALEVVLAVTNSHAQNALAGNISMPDCMTGWSTVSRARSGTAAKMCCDEVMNWEGGDPILFAALWAFARLAQGSEWARGVAGSLRSGRLDFDGCRRGENGQVVSMLWELAENNTVAAGVRWWAVCGLASFGVYGFPSTLGRDLCRAFDDSFLADIAFVLADGSRLHAHAAILAARCPSLLPSLLVKSPRASLASTVGDSEMWSSWEGSSVNEATARPICKEVHVSGRVSYGALRAVMEFVYAGMVHIDVTQIGQVTVLAKRCRLEPLTSLLHSQAPVWGLPPSPCDLASALGSTGTPFADITLQGDRQGGAVKSNVPDRQGKICHVTADYAHAHRVVLSSRCEYFQALFRSGMRDSVVETIHTPLSQEPMEGLIYFLYTGKLSRLTKAEQGCAWNYLEKQEQVECLQGLIELSQLAGQWLLPELQKECGMLVMQHLQPPNLHLGPPVLSHAVLCEQWALVEMCTNSMAPAYTHLRDIGAFDHFDDDLKDLLRAAHVQLALADCQLQPT